MRPEGSGQFKKSTSLELEPATFRKWYGCSESHGWDRSPEQTNRRKGSGENISPYVPSSSILKMEKAHISTLSVNI
jgi:hypothetical protein